MQKKLPMRKNIRLQEYDYSSAGYYFITICINDGHEIFGNIDNGQIIFNKYGKIAECNLLNIPCHIKSVFIDKYVIMPNHVHMIMGIIENLGTRHISSDKPKPDNERTPYMASLQTKSKQTVSKAIQQYKASVSRETKIAGLWQPRFHDHIIRNEEKYKLIWRYIDENPIKWNEDRYYKTIKKD